MNKTRIRYALYLGLAFGLGIAATALTHDSWHMLYSCYTHYDLLSPAKRCGNALPQGEWNYEPLRDALSAKKEELKAKGEISHLSIYFQDLDHGPRFGIGEYDKFSPASLIKVPVLVFFAHAADLEPDILDKTLTFTGSLGIEDNFLSPEETIQPNTPYTIRELLTKMIVYSDNRSYLMLLKEMNALSESTAYHTFRDLDILEMMLDSEETYVSISSYAKLFSILYNTGYLSKDMSQFSLELLAQSTFREGIVAGVPENLTVAHKFGYRVYNGEPQLHDCGIVYHPKMAYTLCVMTSSADENKANAAIVEISRIVYDTISSLDMKEMK